MINIENLKESDIGKAVIYDPGFKSERGLIKSWNDKWIFVVYNCDNNWNNFTDYTAAATNPEDLMFV